MKRNFLVLVVFMFIVALANTAFADSGDCTQNPGPVYTDTGVTIR